MTFCGYIPNINKHKCLSFIHNLFYLMDWIHVYLALILMFSRERSCELHKHMHYMLVGGICSISNEQVLELANKLESRTGMKLQN